MRRLQGTSPYFPRPDVIGSPDVLGEHDVSAPPPSVVLSLHDDVRVAAVKDWIVSLEVTRPEALRATTVAVALQWCGMPFWTKLGKEFYHLSFETEKIQQFWSHSWKQRPEMKVLLLLVLHNGYHAALVSMVGAIFAALLFIFDILPGSSRMIWMGDEYVCSGWAIATGFFLFLLTLLTRRSSTRIFFDRICIPQTDSALKGEAILNLGASLKHSNSMLILWDHTWGQRLWCIFELAAYLKCHGDERNQNESLESTSSRRWTWRRRSTTFEVERSLMILPVFWGRYVQRIFLGCCLFMMSAVFISYDFAIWRMLIYAAILLVVVVLAHWGVVGYFRELDALLVQLRHFHLDSTQCWCCEVNHVDPSTSEPVMCDREVLESCIDDWFGSKTAFEASVQSRVADVVQGKFRSFPLSYGAHLLTLIALPWGSIDIASAYIHAGDYVDGAYFALGLICWWLILVPSIATITISTLRRISQFAGHVWPFHLLLISQYPLISFVQQILWQFLEPRHARLAFSLLSLIPGAVAVYLRC